MRSARWPIAGIVATAVALTALPLGLGTAANAAGTKTWHVLSADKVEGSRITLDIAQSVDPAISSTSYGKGGEANIEKCELVRTERITVARHTRWDTSGARKGITLIMQFNNVTAAQDIFKRAKNKYLPCTAETFGYEYPARVDVKSAFLKKKKELRLAWAIYEDATKTSTLKANGLTIKRAGAALIITRSTTQSLSTINQITNSKLTARQFARYKAVAFF
jgi:hypothetical protein